MKNEYSTDPQEFEDRASSEADASPNYHDVVDAIERLPQDLQDILNTHFWQRLSHPEAIRQLGIPASTYHRKLGIAKQRLEHDLRRLYEVREVPAED